MINRIANKKLAFNLSLIYVVFATIYCYWAAANQVSDGVLNYLFFPVIVLPLLLLLVESNPALPILICQIITLFVIYSLFLVIVKFFRPNFERKTKST